MRRAETRDRTAEGLVERRGLPNLELRSVEVAGKDVQRITGYAAVFDSESHDLGGFIEVVRPGAFRDFLATEADVYALVQHDRSRLLGSTRGGTLELKEDAKGLQYQVDLPDTQVARDLVVMMQRGDITGSSFGFVTREDRWTTSDDPDKPELRELLKVDLLDVGPVVAEAYPATTADARELRAASEARGDTVAGRGGLVVPTRLYQARQAQLRLVFASTAPRR